MKMSSYTLLSVISSLLSSCGGDTLPKPKRGLRLDYTSAVYVPITQLLNCLFSLQASSPPGMEYQAYDYNIDIEYPMMHATTYLTYKPVEGNLKKLPKDAQKFTYEHTIKADSITSTVFANDSTYVHGVFYRVHGNTASQLQSYVTDSLRHFVSGSIYFKVVSNYDSVQSASAYMEKDTRKIMESLQQK